MLQQTHLTEPCSRGQQRQVFLFKDCVILCKLKRGPGANADVYGFKNKMKVRKV